MALTLPPPPIGADPGSQAWLDWYTKLGTFLSAGGAIPWASIDFTGANLTDLPTRQHNDLQGIQGGTSNQYYHLTAAQYASLPNTITANANTVYAGPSSGGPATPTFRALTAADMPGGFGTGTVTSVGLSLPSSIMSVTGSPVTTSGTLTANLETQAAKSFFAGPTSGAGVPTFRAIAATDLPAISGRLLNVQVFDTPGSYTYTPTAGTTAVIVEVLGAGGAGGGSAAVDGSHHSTGSGGGGGGYAKSYLTSGFSGVTVTVGAGGTGISGATGNAGGATFFGSAPSAAGGSGGVTAPVLAFNLGTWQSGGYGGGGFSGNIVSHYGCIGGDAFLIGSQFESAGKGADSIYGSGGGGAWNADGGVATGYGSGGGGSAGPTSAGAHTGGNGAPGLVIVYEYGG